MHSHFCDRQQVACTEAVPGVLNAVIAKANVEAALPQFFDSGHPSSFGISVGSSLESDVNEWVGNEINV